MEVKIKLKGGAVVPQYETKGSSGLDLRCLKEELIFPQQTILIPTGIFIQMSQGHEGQVRSRSGLTIKKNLIVLNAPGTIDEDYRGEIKVILHNVGDVRQEIEAGDRIAQLVFAPVSKATFVITNSLYETERGQGGFGSTGEK